MAIMAKAGLFIPTAQPHAQHPTHLEQQLPQQQQSQSQQQPQQQLQQLAQQQQQPRLVFFDKVLADVGDSQNLQQSLSTFSGHIRRVRAILEDATPNSLVLLDEVSRVVCNHENSEDRLDRLGVSQHAAVSRLAVNISFARLHQFWMRLKVAVAADVCLDLDGAAFSNLLPREGYLSSESGVGNSAFRVLHLQSSQGVWQKRLRTTLTKPAELNVVW